MVDRIDAAIIDLLVQNPRLGYAEMARRVGVSEGTARSRVERLQSHNVVSFQTKVNWERLGYPIVARVGLRVEPTALPSVAEALKRIKEVRLAKYTSGSYDIIAEVILRSHKDLLQLLSDRIGAIPGVAQLGSSIIIDEIELPFHSIVDYLPRRGAPSDRLSATVNDR